MPPPPASRLKGLLTGRTGLAFAFGLMVAVLKAGETATPFRSSIRPILEEKCFDCHAEGSKKGGVSFDTFKTDADLLADTALWHRVLKNVRAGLMPPPDKEQPSADESRKLQQWIKDGVFHLDPAQPDPGRPVLRRLNRTEYRNTIRDLTGVDFKANEEFPADDTGHGFDNIGEVLTLSPMLLEKYLTAAKEIIREAVPHNPAKEANNSSEKRRRWFPKEVPADPPARLAYASELLGNFAARAFRRPLRDDTAERLAQLAESIWTQPGESFESGVSRSMEAVLASPRFLFIEEFSETPEPGHRHPRVDEHTLACRLSYFLWSTMPDEELLRLAGEGKLRANLTAQFRRMMADPKSQSLFRNFTGQWLQSRDVEGIALDARFILLREQKPEPEAEEARRVFLELRKKGDANLTAEDREKMDAARAVFKKVFDRFKDSSLGGDTRRDMRRETEMYVEHVFRQDRPLAELIDGNYTFLNRRLAKHYGVEGVEGEELHLVTLPAGSERGGLLTQGTFLTVTSNPTRTSPVKRGLFILDNILGTPPPPPPPNIPALEEPSLRNGKAAEATLRETLAKHRADAKCASCHNRMDPLGLAFENFNAMGKWRDAERGLSLEPAGQLVSGEKFNGAAELKRILVTNHREAFHRCLTEKLLTYALGRGLDHRDETTVDALLARLDHNNGRASALLEGIIESDAFQRRRVEN